jgi:hypothetical protein
MILKDRWAKKKSKKIIHQSSSVFSSHDFTLVGVLEIITGLVKKLFYWAKKQENRLTKSLAYFIAMVLLCVSIVGITLVVLNLFLPNNAVYTILSNVTRPVFQDSLPHADPNHKC